MQNYRRRTLTGAALAATSYLGNTILRKATNKAIDAVASKAVQSLRPKSKLKIKPSSRKRVYKTKKNSTKSIQRQLRTLSQKVNNGQGRLIYFRRATAGTLCQVNLTSHTSSSSGMSNLETVLGELRFFNPSAPATLIQGSGASGTYSRKYMFDVYAKCHIRNNYQIPVKACIYVCVPKADTSWTPQETFANGLADVGITETRYQMINLTDSPQFNQLWKIASVKKITLQAGQELDLAHSTGKFTYDPAEFDSHTLEYQKSYKSFVFLVRVMGPLGHDTVQDEQGFLRAGVDMSFTYKYKVEYEAGVDLTYYVVSDGADSFTTGPVVSSRPVADNINSSVS